MKTPLISIVVPSYNNERYIKKCINSILKQNFKNFELFIVDDCSSDNTVRIINKIKDKRIKILKTSKNSGSAVARNIGIKNSKGKYVFFIDGDCIATKNWLGEGIKSFSSNKGLGVEGKIIYVSNRYKPTAIDNIAQNIYGGRFMGGNIAYKKDLLNLVKGFNENLIRGQDRDISMRILKLGKIIFNPKMLVYHQKYPWTFTKKLKMAKECSKTKVHVFSKYNDQDEIYFRIYKPLNLIGFFFPPAIIGSLFLNRFRSIEDFKTFLWLYPIIFMERIYLWKAAIKEKVFLF